jgi:hypothetical protein
MPTAAMKRATPPPLTRREKTLLRRSANIVRMYVACMTFLAAVLSFLIVIVKYDETEKVNQTPVEIPLTATLGTISGIYLPIFAAVAAYVWATRAFPEREAAPHGFAMALFRDVFTLLVVTVVLVLPPYLYLAPGKILKVNTFMVWYQTVVTAAAGGAFTYYFHASIGPRTARRQAPASAGPPRAGHAEADAAPHEDDGDGPRVARRVRRSPRRPARGGRGKTTE